MNRAMVLEHLEQARRHVVDGEKHVARQHDLVEELERDGHDTRQARDLLYQFQEVLKLLVQDRDRLERLAASPY